MKKLSLIIAIFISTSIFSQNISLESYKFGEGLQFNADRGHSIRLTGYAQPMIDLKNYTDVEENSSTSRYRIRRLRLRIDGKSKNQKFGYRFQADLSGTSETGEDTGDYLLDAYVSYAVTNRISILFGQRATYTDNRELFMNSNSLQLVERSRLTSAFSSIREFGLFVTGRFRAGRGSYLRPYFVLTNGDGINVFDKDHGGLKIGGRLDYLPFGLFTNLGQFRQIDVMREQAPKLVLGVHFSHNSGMSSRRGRASGAIIYLDENDQESLPDYTKYGIDFLFKYKGFSALGEYIKSTAIVPDDITQRVRNDGSISESFLVDGLQNVDGYVKGRMMLGQAYNIQMGYLFKSGYSVDTRYTHLKADENSFLNNATFYNRPNYYTIGIGKLLAKNYGAKIQASITYVDGSLGINNTQGSPIEGNEWLTRIITTISF
ncbi:MAG: porin [Flavobacteriaceae bacterium]|nr:porin [Flavobacteriaceae bacterium]